MSTLIIICSKSPNQFLYECVENLYKIQINNSDTNYKVCIVDSDSHDLTNYHRINESFPNVEICYAKNRNYEYGAWKYAYSLYPNYTNYFCIQDSIIIKNQIDLNVINNTNAYTFHNNTGYHWDPTIKDKGIDNLKTSGLNYSSIIHSHFTLAQHSIFIVNNYVMNDIFQTLRIPPIDKDGSCFYERNFGLYFILKNIKTFDLNDYMVKHSGNRK
jgi:hypothetical protein